jgi:hypothetical protein
MTRDAPMTHPKASKHERKKGAWKYPAREQRWHTFYEEGMFTANYGNKNLTRQAMYV